jgi:hypothetical protein
MSAANQPSEPGGAGSFIVNLEGSTSGLPRSLRARARRHEFTAIWVALGLVGVSVALYAVRIGYQARVVEPTPGPPSVAASPEPEPAPPATRRRPQRPLDGPPKAAAKATTSVEPEVEYVTETPQTKDATTTEPTKAFETGKLFDQPTGRDRNGRPGSSSFENPSHGRLSTFERPEHGYNSRRAPNPSPSQRPNVPDPSFEKPL